MQNETSSIPLQTKSLFELPKAQQPGAAKQLERGFEKTYERNQPLAHRGDPLSSYKAGDKALRSGRISGQMRFVLDALKTYPNTTSAELAKYAMLDRYVISRRLPVLAARGLVVRGPERFCKVCKSHCLTWRPLR